MSEENNNFTDSDPCPDEQELKSYASGEMASSRFGRIIGCHLEFCPSCRSRVEKIRKTEVAVDETIKVFAERLRRQQEKLVVEKWRGPNPGTLWRTVPESDEELFGPIVIVLEESDGILTVGEISEDISEAIHTDMVLEVQQSGLTFRCMVRAGNIFQTAPSNLKTFAGRLPSSLTNKVVEFCRSADHFDDEIPLTKYKFGRDPNGTVLMHRKGTTSGMLVTEDDDLRLRSFSELTKERCSYLRYVRGPASSSVIDDCLILDETSMMAELVPNDGSDFEFTLDDGTPEPLLDPKKGKAVLQAAQSGGLGLLRELVTDRRSANFSDQEHGTEPLHLAALNGHLAAAEFLLDKGAIIDSWDKDGKTSLILAAAGGHLDMVQLLLKKRANRMLSDNGGRTALYWALANGHEEIAEILRSRSRSR